MRACFVQHGMDWLCRLLPGILVRHPASEAEPGDEEQPAITPSIPIAAEADLGSGASSARSADGFGAASHIDAAASPAASSTLTPTTTAEDKLRDIEKYREIVKRSMKSGAETSATKEAEDALAASPASERTTSALAQLPEDNFRASQRLSGRFLHSTLATDDSTKISSFAPLEGSGRLSRYQSEASEFDERRRQSRHSITSPRGASPTFNDVSRQPSTMSTGVQDVNQVVTLLTIADTASQDSCMQSLSMCCPHSPTEAMYWFYSLLESRNTPPANQSWKSILWFTLLGLSLLDIAATLVVLILYRCVGNDPDYCDNRAIRLIMAIYPAAIVIAPLIGLVAVAIGELPVCPAAFVWLRHVSPFLPL